MVNPVRAQKPSPSAPKRVVPVQRPFTIPFTIQGLWRLGVWGGTAAAALLFAVLATHSEIGSLRAAGALSSLTGRRVALVQSDQMTPATLPAINASTTPPSSEAQAETRRLAEAVRSLMAENNQMRMRLAAVENNVSDFTGSVTRQVEEAKYAARAWPDDMVISPVTSAMIANLISPTLTPPDGLGAATTAPLTVRPQPQLVAAPPATAPTPEAEMPKAVPVFGPGAIGVDIGSALSIQALRARWAGIRSAHPLLFDNLVPLANVKEGSKSGGVVELRLVAGPLPDADAAMQFCTSLAAYHLYCKPAAYNGQQLPP
jgi:hypothetical protein